MLDVLAGLLEEHVGLVGDKAGAVANETDGLDGNVGRGRVARELGEALDGVLERVEYAHEVLVEAVAHNLVERVEGERDDALVVLRGGQVEHAEHVLPARLDVLRLRLDHLRYALHNHVAYRVRPTPQSQSQSQSHTRTHTNQTQ